MNWQDIGLETLNEDNIAKVREIRREDVSEDFVGGIDVIMQITQYGIDHHCLGHTYAIKYKENYVGVIILGEAIPWETDPEEMKKTPFYRLMGFIIDNRYRGLGIGSWVLESVIDRCYQEFGVRPIALGCHKDNHKAARFYLKHGFRKTDVMESNDYYFLRYPSAETQDKTT